jgi:hypothetical protein
VDTTPPSGSLAINPTTGNGITATKTNIVNLSVSGILDTDSGYKDVSFSNSSSGPWTTFQSGTTYLSWSLSDSLYGGGLTKGTKTVYVKLRDNVGNTSEPISQSIIWEDTSPTHPVPQVDSTDNQSSSYDPDIKTWNGNSSATISWLEPHDPDPSSGIYQYRVYRAKNSSAAQDAALVNTTSNLSFTDSNLVDGNSYYYFIQAIDNAQNSSNYLVGASSAQVELPDTTPPYIPLSFTAIGTDSTTIDVSWKTAPENSTANGGKANSYILERTTKLGSTEPADENSDCSANTYTALSGKSPISFEQSGIYDSETDTYTITDDTILAEEWYYYRATAYDTDNRTSSYTCYKARGNFAPVFKQEDITLSVNNNHTTDTVQPGDTITVNFKVTDADGREDLDTVMPLNE